MKREWLILYRESKRLTQAQVASFSFIDRSYYSQIETGKRNPSLTVANNIAKALDFDPMMFFQDHLNQSTFQQNVLSGEIPEFFRCNGEGEVLYLYNDFELYSHHAVSYLLTAVEKDSFCIIIDYEMTFNHLKRSLETILTKREIKKYIHFVNKEDLGQYEPSEMVTYFQRLVAKFDEDKLVRIWSHEKQYDDNDWLSKLEKYLTTKRAQFNNKKVLIIRSYNASMVKAVSHIRMMRNYPYLMTDFEIVDSPFYIINSNSSVFPSLFIQENM
ncbi:helix-turn-helix domain-containing protein [Ornithinibacillus salinisoli]|uniref:Helix-turn-helix domain-containing protein n=1 Tax=Ornithinibacillus salinisoli TaxID=1848459 RepID=A0ABW4W2D0_9BACI